MPKRVLDVGQCDLDHASIRRLIQATFAAEVVRAHAADDALALMLSGAFDLVLVNRVFDRDQGEGLEFIRRIKSDPRTAGVPAMLVTNFAVHQEAAVAAGAVNGFGKADLSTPATLARIQPYLT